MSAQNDEHRFARLDGQDIDARRLNRTSAQEVKEAAREGRVTCQVCKEAMVPKLGEQLVWHFAHRADRTYTFHEPESINHKNCKELLLEWSLKTWPGCEARCEWRLPEIRQIADVLALPPGRAPLALEIQYSDLSAADWRARHQGYRGAGLDDIWFLGAGRLNEASKGKVRLDALSSALVSEGHELMYLGPKGALTWVRVAPALRFRARQGRLGTVEALVEKGHIDQLVLDGSRPALRGSA